MFSLPCHALLLDIETSGLKRERDQIISIGIVYNDSQNKPLFKYHFLETKEDEKQLLDDFLLFLEPFQTIYTYYGRGFDYPFLLSRMEHYKLNTGPFLKCRLMDMKDSLKYFASSRQDLEAALSFKRTSNTQGKDVINLYRTYETSKVPIYKELIFRHQEDELGSLITFYEIYHLLFGIQNLPLIKQEVTDSQLILHFKASAPLSYSFTKTAFGWQFSFKEGEAIFTVVLPLVKTSLKQYLEPVKDYFFVESQGQLMHKSLAQFIPASLRRKATKEECVIQKESTFLKVFTSYKVTSPLWHDDTKSMYIEADDFSVDLFNQQLFYLFFQRQGYKPVHS